MKKKGKYIMIFIMFFTIIISGLIRVNTCLPQSVKDKLNLKVSFKAKPFDFTIETKNYVFYINKNILKEAKDNVNNILNFAIDKTTKFRIPLNKVYNNIQSEFNNSSDRLCKKVNDLGKKAENVFKSLKAN